MPSERHDSGGEVSAPRKLPAESPHEVDGLCSRCWAAWPCLRCLTATPPYVPIWNNL